MKVLKWRYPIYHHGLPLFCIVKFRCRNVHIEILEFLIFLSILLEKIQSLFLRWRFPIYRSVVICFYSNQSLSLVRKQHETKGFSKHSVSTNLSFYGNLIAYLPRLLENWGCLIPSWFTNWKLDNQVHVLWLLKRIYFW